MAKRKCSFCGLDIASGTGTIYAQSDGTVYVFCTRKCETNMIKLKRGRRTTRWTEKFQAEKKKKGGA